KCCGQGIRRHFPYGDRRRTVQRRTPRRPGSGLRRLDHSQRRGTFRAQWRYYCLEPRTGAGLRTFFHGNTGRCGKPEKTAEPVRPGGACPALLPSAIAGRSPSTEHRRRDRAVALVHVPAEEEAYWRSTGEPVARKSEGSICRGRNPLAVTQASQEFHLIRVSITASPDLLPLFFSTSSLLLHIYLNKY